MSNYTPVAETVENTEETDVKQEFMGSTEQPGKLSGSGWSRWTWLREGSPYLSFDTYNLILLTELRNLKIRGTIGGGRFQMAGNVLKINLAWFF